MTWRSTPSSTCSARTCRTSSTTTCIAPSWSARAPRCGSQARGCPQAVHHRHRPLEPHPQHRGPRAGPRADAADGPPRRGQPLDRAASSSAEGRTGVPIELIYNGVDLDPLRRAGGVLHAAGGVRLPRGRADGRRRGAAGAGEGPPDAAGGVAARAGAGARKRGCSSSATAAAARRSRPRRRSSDLLGEPCHGDTCVGTATPGPDAKVVFTGLRDDIPAVTAALDVAVLPSYREAQGMVDPGGDGAAPPGGCQRTSAASPR